MTVPPTAVVVMAKAPVPGAVKTRLMPALGAAAAAALAARMLRHAVQQARAAALGPVWLCGAPRADDAAFEAAFGGVLPADVQRMDQGEGDLGARMARAAAARLADHAQVLITGTDCPALDAAVLRAAATVLATHDVVLVPALDGGYVMVGLRAGRDGLLTAMFDGLPWSTPALLDATRERLAAGGWRHAELPPLADIDEPADLQHLPPGWRA
jgi:rSAM/selenodomain-associated transferase 1